MTTRSPLSTVTVIIAVDGKEVRRFDAVSAHLLKMSMLNMADSFKAEGKSALVFVRPDKIAEHATFGSVSDARQILKLFGAAKSRHSPVFTLDMVDHHRTTPDDDEDSWT